MTAPVKTVTLVTTKAAQVKIWRDPLLLFAAVTCVAIRIGYNLALHSGTPGAQGFVIDEREYFAAAHYLFEGRGFSFFDTALWLRPPVYVLFLGALIRLFGSGNAAALVAQSMISALTLFPIYQVGHNIGGRTSARTGVILAILYLPFTLFAGLLLSETVFLFFVSWAFVFLLGAAKTSASAPNIQFYGTPALAGAALALAALTRATALAFIPIAAVWLAFTCKEFPWKARAARSVLVLGVGVVFLVPWTARNYVAYGRLVAVETTAGYNLWLASTGVRDEERLQGDLRPLSNPVARQDFAFAQALSNIGSDRAAFVKKGVKESIDFWQPLFSAEERQTKGYSLGRVPAAHLASLLVFDDALYVVILVLAIFGLAASPHSPERSLTLVWIVFWVLTAFVFFAVTRFRLAVVLGLIPWAWPGLETLRFSRPFAQRKMLVGGASALLALIVTIPGIALPEYATGIRNYFVQSAFRQAELLLASGRADEAIPLYHAADQSLADTRYGLAAALLQLGQTQAAVSQLRSDEPADRFEPDVLRGDAARRSGDLSAARALFNRRVVRQSGSKVLDWAWTHLSPEPVTRIAVGTGLDIGYVRGFDAAETTSAGREYRWSGEKVEWRDLTGSKVSIAVSGWRPAGAARARVVTQYGNPELRIGTEDAWQTLSVDRASSLQVNGFVPGGYDQRLLGVRITEILAQP